MINFLNNWWKEIDQINFLIIIFLIIIGMILSFSVNDSSAFFNRHLTYALIAVFIIIFLSFLDSKTLRRVALVGILISIILLIAILFVNDEIKGSTRWLRILGYSVQPSEFAKPFFFMLSGWFLSKGIQGQKISMYLVFVTFFLLAGLIILQPDFGMTMLFSISFFCQLFIAGLSLLLVSIAIFILLLLSIFSYYRFNHVRKRFDDFFQPSSGTDQIDQSLKAFKSGGLLGKGPGQGTLKESIPEANTDFIFAVAGEELGFIVCCFIVILILILVIRSLLNLLKIDELDIIIAIGGLASCFGLQTLINIFSTLKLIPTKGMTLPLISYGGSSMISSAILFGFLLSLTRKRRK